MRVLKVAAGIHWIDIPEADLRILCGCPADCVKHLMKRGLVIRTEVAGTVFETGPNAILLSDISLQNGEFSNLSEFPVLQMLYRQGTILPGHPNNKGIKPLLIGLKEQVAAQLDYIHRGNYGLLSQEELEAAGVMPAQAAEWMRIKLRFAFGKIGASEDLVDCCIVGEGLQTVRNGVSIRRLDLNVYEFYLGDESVVVDLNLDPGENYELPYPLNYHNLRREYFAVVHSGEGDGWDYNRPTMSSVLMFQGKIYLVDAGPNLQHILKALGIGISEIEGVFHTHSHDDHFCVLPTLIRADRRIRYFATPPVRAAVTKKLAALMSIDERDFEHYFEICDLHLDCWNDVEGLQVRPAFSPHPVETTIFTFRAQSECGERTYAHFADIVSFNVLRQMIEKDPKKPGILPETWEKVQHDYLEPADLKKIDVGGGLIHGSAEDFRGDSSKKIILSHTALELNTVQRRIGSGSPFGTFDVLIPSARDYSLRKAHNYLTAYFPDVPQHELEMLLNRPIEDINAETIVLRQGEYCHSVVMPLTGLIEAINADDDTRYLLPAGILIGESASLYDQPATKTYRAASFVKAISWPAELYRSFIAHNDLMDMARATSAMRGIFARSWLFGENMSIPMLNQLARESVRTMVAAGEVIEVPTETLYLVNRGTIDWRVHDRVLDIFEESDFLGEAMVLFGTPMAGHAVAQTDAELFAVPGTMLRDIPIVRWKMFETYQRHMRLLLAPASEGPAFPWSADYLLGIRDMDQHHRKLFELGDRVMAAIEAEDPPAACGAMIELIDFANYHFNEEIKLFAETAYPAKKEHVNRHNEHMSQLSSVRRKIEAGKQTSVIESSSDFRNFFNKNIIEHIFQEDRKFSSYVYDKDKFAL